MNIIIISWGLSILFGLITFLFIIRIILTWYPQAELNRFPWILITCSTEPFLTPIRKVIPPLGGVDISPIILVGVCSFLREILLGQQGLITIALQNH